MTTLISTTQAAQRLGLTREQVLRRIGRGDLDAQFVGGRWLVDGRSADEYAARRGQAGAERGVEALRQAASDREDGS